MASTKLSRTAGTPTSSKKFTISYWTKKPLAASAGHIFDTYVDGTNRSQIHFDSDAVIDFRLQVSGSNTGRLLTNRKFRDSSAWYHIVAAVDTTLSTADDRVKLYVNGVQETSFSNRINPSQNADFPMGGTHTIGAYGGGTNYYDGLLSHFHFTDGYVYPASTFGSTDSTSGIWKPNTSPSVTYGTNGFFLKFENSSAMGTDSSGQSNTFTVSGSLTQTVDSPDNNFATFNANYKSLNQPTYTQGNLTVTTSDNSYRLSFSSIANSTGKWYAEFKRVVGTTDEVFLGVSSENDVNHYFPITNEYLGASSKSVGITSGNGKYYISSSATTYAASYIAGDIIGIALDLTNKKLYASKNGAWSTGSGAWGSTTFNASTGAIDISSIIASGEFGFLGCSNSGTGTFTANFGNGYFGTTAVATAGTNASGNGIFEYDVPTGYTALSTKGLNL